MARSDLRQDIEEVARIMAGCCWWWLRNFFLKFLSVLLLSFWLTFLSDFFFYFIYPLFPPPFLFFILLFLFWFIIFPLFLELKVKNKKKKVEGEEGGDREDRFWALIPIWRSIETNLEFDDGQLGDFGEEQKELEFCWKFGKIRNKIK